jgi:trimeric autotransporter adhesin
MSVKLWLGIIAPLAIIVAVILISTLPEPPRPIVQQVVIAPNGTQMLVNVSGDGTGLLDGLVAYYPEDGNHRDAHGRHHGRLIGESTPAEGVVRQSMSFDNRGWTVGTDDSRVVATIPGVNNWDEMTISTWYWLEPGGGTMFGFPQIDEFTNRNVERSDDESISIWSGTNPNVITESEPLENHRWYHIVMTWDRTGPQALYIDGEFVDTDPVASKYGSIGDKFYWGAWFNGYGVAGRVDEIGIWDRVLSPEEIRQLYNNGHGLAYDELR